MKNATAYLAIIVVAILAFGGGYLVNSQIMADSMMMGKMDDSHGHATDLPHEHGSTHHELMDISDWDDIPTIDVIVHADPKSGWNLQIVTTNYRFAPESASLDHVDGEGHAHLYIDGEKITRLYGEWYHLPELSPGQHEIIVSLSSNNHNDYAIAGEIISDAEIISA